MCYMYSVLYQEHKWTQLRTPHRCAWSKNIGKENHSWLCVHSSYSLHKPFNYKARKYSKKRKHSWNCKAQISDSRNRKDLLTSNTFWILHVLLCINCTYRFIFTVAWMIEKEIKTLISTIFYVGTKEIV